MEKLSSRLLPANSNKHRFSDSLNSQRWRFLKSGLDDFRSGFPPSSDNIIIQGRKGLSPIILQSRSHLTQQKARKISVKPTCKLKSEVEARKEFMKDINHHLSHCPQLLHSHLKDRIFPKVKLLPFSCSKHLSSTWNTKTVQDCVPSCLKSLLPHYLLQTGSQQSANVSLILL